MGVLRYSSCMYIHMQGTDTSLHIHSEMPIENGFSNI